MPRTEYLTIVLRHPDRWENELMTQGWTEGTCDFGLMVVWRAQQLEGWKEAIRRSARRELQKQLSGIIESLQELVAVAAPSSREVAAYRSGVSIASGRLLDALIEETQKLLREEKEVQDE